MKRDPRERPEIVYSTDPGWRREGEELAREERPAGVPAGEGQTAEVLLEKRQKGKVVTLARGFRSSVGPQSPGSRAQRAHQAGLEALAKKLKSACGAGGTVREGTIEIQGDHRDKVAAALEGLGFRVRRR